MYGLVVGPGAGSKLLQSLLDGTEGLYTIPGYILMYFYPHYKEVKRKVRDNNKLILEILDRMPPLYNSTMMPGSESLDKIGRGSGDHFSVQKEIFLSTILGFIPKCSGKLCSSRDLLIALHKAHFQHFSYIHSKGKEFPQNILYHIHDSHYLPDLLRDFPELKLIATTRRPSLNLERRRRSSILEADSTKLTKLDSILLAPLSISKVPSYHLKMFQIHMSLKCPIIYIDYDSMINNEAAMANFVRSYMGLKHVSEEKLKPTFFGLPYGATFYTQKRGKSIQEIRDEYIKNAANSSLSKLDNLYITLTSGDKQKLPKLSHYFLEVITESRHSLSILTQACYPNRLLSFLGTACKPQKEYHVYNPMHGYFRFKWSTPKRLLYFLALMSRLSNSKVVFIGVPAQIFRIMIYCFLYVAVIIALPLLLVKRVYVQTRLYFLALSN